VSEYPYAGRFGVMRTLPEVGRTRDDILCELQTMASEEDALWETGKCSGTIYRGEHDHYAFLGQAFELFAHANALQRDMCPSATRFEGELIAMALDLLHADCISGTEAGGVVTNGGTGSILHAVLAYREHATKQGSVGRPNIIKPETAHPAFDKACHLLGVELRSAPVDQATSEVDVSWVADHIDDQTIAVIASACNYGYGIIDPIDELAELTFDRGIGLHVDACLGGFILPFGEELGYAITPFDFRIPGVTSISVDNHKYGYALKGTSTLLFRDREIRNSQYFFLTQWSGGAYCSPGIEGSRSDGLLAAAWAAMAHLGRSGYRRHAASILETAKVMQDAIRSHSELRIIGQPTFLLSFTSDSFDVYHVNDFMATRGWRFNGQQSPNAIHMAVTGPQTRPGVAQAFASDLAHAVDYARDHADRRPRTNPHYGGDPGAPPGQADESIRRVLSDMLDRQQGLPPRTPP
jgi:sphinganine-1-phosphate aldolase